jgi:hypothetical protein
MSFSRPPSSRFRRPVHPLVAHHMLLAASAVRSQSILLDLSTANDGVALPLGDHHPATWLLGTTCRVDSLGLAVLSPGRVISAGPAASSGQVASSVGGSRRDDHLAPGTQALAVQIVMADGSSSICMESSRYIASADFQEGGEGLVPDAMRRALRLPTDPANIPIGWYWAAAWLDDLSGIAADVDAAELASWHPAIDWREVVGRSDIAVLDLLLQRHRDHAVATSWEGVRVAAARGSLHVGHCSTELATWFDAGSFCRWLMSQLPTPSVLCDTAMLHFDLPGRMLVAAVLNDMMTNRSRRGVDLGPN